LREDLGQDLFIALPEELHKKLSILILDPDFLAARTLFLVLFAVHMVDGSVLLKAFRVVLLAL